MFNKTTQINNISRTEINEYNPETITLNISNVDKGFFITCKRNSEQYQKLLCEAPVFLEESRIQLTKENMRYNTDPRMYEGAWRTRVTKVPVKVVNIQYIGNNDFLFNLVKF